MAGGEIAENRLNPLDLDPAKLNRNPCSPILA